MKRLTVEEVSALKLTELQLEGVCVSLTSVEALAASLRRVAGLVCPCSPQTIIRSITGPLEAITDDSEALGESVEETLDALLALGDLIESQEQLDSESTSRRRIVYAAQPAFVPLHSGGAILLGVAPDGVSPLTQELLERVEVNRHVRRLPSGDPELHSKLRQLGLLELTEATWLKCPPPELAKQHIARYDVELNKASGSGALPELEILDPSTEANYYRGRWTPPKRKDGRYVARRRQAYGAALWCYVELRDGEPERFIDLPPAHSRWRGCDDAWRLQMAIDANRGTPQQVRVRTDSDVGSLEFFSPIPMWACRRLDGVGVVVEKKGCLFAYSMPREDVDGELQFLEKMLWLRRTA